MKRYLGLVLVVALVGCGCSSPVEKVKTSANAYSYYADRFEEHCPSYDTTLCPAWKNYAYRLQRWNKYLKEAQKASERGGKYPLQLKSLKDIEKETKKSKEGQ